MDRDLIVGLHGGDLIRDVQGLGLGVRGGVGDPLGPFSHPPAELGFLLYQNHVATGSSGVQGGFQAGDPTPHHQHGPVHLFLEGLREVGLLAPDDTHTQVVLGHHVRVLVVGLVSPNDLLPEVHPGGEDVLEGEGIRHEPLGASCYHDAVHAVVHVLSDDLPALVPAETVVLSAEPDAVFVGGDILQRVHVQSAADVAPATEVNGYLLVHEATPR